MSEEKTKIISDLVKITKYRSHLPNADQLFTDALYSDKSMDDLKKIHDIYTRYLLEYQNLREPYPKVIETLEYTNHGIKLCISNHREKKDDTVRKQ
jgi:FMN phosphatase YigB (HAD superfamily)